MCRSKPRIYIPYIFLRINAAEKNNYKSRNNRAALRDPLALSNISACANLKVNTRLFSTFSLNAQLEAVSLFTSENFLQLNPSKCEIVSFKTE